MKGTKAKAGSPARSLPAMRVGVAVHSAGSRILAAINEATEVLRTEGLGSGLLTVRTYRFQQLHRISAQRRAASAEAAWSESGCARRVPRSERQHAAILGAGQAAAPADRMPVSLRDRIRRCRLAVRGS